MQTRLGLACSILVLWLAACGGGGGSDSPVQPSEPADSADYLPFNVGDFHDQGSQGRRQVLGLATESGTNVWRVREGVPSDSHVNFYQRTANAVVFLGSRSSDPISQALGDVEVFRLPARVGQSWTMYDTRIAQGPDLDLDGRPDPVSTRAVMSTIGYEAVQVPAGHFDRALHMQIQNQQSVTLSSNGRAFDATLVTDIWYVANVGEVQRRTRQTTPLESLVVTVELKGYRVGAASTDLSAPTVTLSNMSEGSRSTEALLEFWFSKEMDPSSASATPVMVTGADGQTIAGTVLWTGQNNNSVIFDARSLRLEGEFQVTLSPQLTDLYGNRLAQPPSFRVTFDSRPPHVLSVTPAAQSTDVPLDVHPVVQFSEAIAQASAQSAIYMETAQGVRVPGDVIGAGATWTFVPSAPLIRNATYKLVVGPNDLMGNVMPGESFSFQTVAGQFDAVWSPFTSASVMDAVSIDLDGDGRLDIVLLDFDGHVMWLKQDEFGKLEPRQLAISPISSSSKIIVQDMDGDGRPDLLFDQSVNWFRQVSAGVFEPRALLPDGLFRSVLAVIRMSGGTFGVVGDWYGPSYLARQSGPGSFSNFEFLGNEFYSGPWGVGDFNADGLDDLIATHDLADGRFSISMHLQLPDGTFGAAQTLAVFSDGKVMSLAIADFNRDGLPDLVFNVRESWDSNRIWVQTQRSSGGWNAPVPLATSPVGTLKVVDTNLDGRPDVLSVMPGSIVLHEQRPDGTLAAGEAYVDARASGLPRNGLPFAFGDFTGDGLPDVFYGYLIWRQRPNTAVPSASAAHALGLHWPRPHRSSAVAP